LMAPVSTTTNVAGEEVTTTTLSGLVATTSDADSGFELTICSAGRTKWTDVVGGSAYQTGQGNRREDSDRSESATALPHPAPTPHSAQRAVQQHALEIRRRCFAKHVVEQTVLFGFRFQGSIARGCRPAVFAECAPVAISMAFSVTPSPKRWGGFPTPKRGNLF